ncbi:MAG: hypothetical protein J5911_04835 [Clostridia bacterium]|nr:hypothetical protein [Clostridia bacterium]
MTIKDIIKTAAVYLNLTDVIGYLDNDIADPSSSTLSQTDRLTRLANLTISELAASYVPMVCSQQVTAENGRIVFSDLTYNVTRILSVKNQFGQDAEFKIFPEYIEVFGGTYTIEYEYAPSNYGLNGTVGFNKKVTAALLGYGVAAEFCVMEGRFEEAILWRKRYTYGVERIAIPKNAAMKGRCWL